VGYYDFEGFDSPTQRATLVPVLNADTGEVDLVPGIPESDVTEFPGGSQWSGALGVDLDMFSAKVIYTALEFDGGSDADWAGIGLGTTFGEFGIDAYYAQIVDSNIDGVDGLQAYGVGATYDLGGGARVEGGVASVYSVSEQEDGFVDPVAVSKVQPEERVRAVLDAGQRVFGENRVQEAEGRWPPFRAAFAGIALHLVGPLQSNKVNRASISSTRSTASTATASRASSPRAVQARGACPELFVQVNTGPSRRRRARPRRARGAARRLPRPLRPGDQRADVHPAGRGRPRPAFRRARRDRRPPRPRGPVDGHERRFRDRHRPRIARSSGRAQTHVRPDPVPYVPPPLVSPTTKPRPLRSSKRRIGSACVAPTAIFGHRSRGPEGATRSLDHAAASEGHQRRSSRGPEGLRDRQPVRPRLDTDHRRRLRAGA
jgi:hypothetical protein